MFQRLVSSCGHANNFEFSDAVTRESIEKYVLLVKRLPCRACEKRRSYVKNTYEKLVRMLDLASDIKTRHDILNTIGELEIIGDIPI